MVTFLARRRVDSVKVNDDLERSLDLHRRNPTGRPLRVHFLGVTVSDVGYISSHQAGEPGTV